MAIRLSTLVTAAVLAVSAPANLLLLTRRSPPESAEKPEPSEPPARPASLGFDKGKRRPTNELGTCELAVQNIRRRLQATASDPPLDIDDARFESRPPNHALTEQARQATARLTAAASLDLDCRQDVCRLRATGPGALLPRDELESDAWMRRRVKKVQWGDRTAFVQLRERELTDGRGLLEDALRAFRLSGAVESCGPAPEQPLTVRLDVKGEDDPVEERGVIIHVGGGGTPFGGCVAEALRRAVAAVQVPAGTASATLIAKIPEPRPILPPPPTPRKPKMPWQKYD